MMTETPAFAAFDVRLDRGGGDPGQLGTGRLREGLNIAEVRTRNGSGVTGVIGSLAVVR